MSSAKSGHTPATSRVPRDRTFRSDQLGIILVGVDDEESIREFVELERKRSQLDARTRHGTKPRVAVAQQGRQLHELHHDFLVTELRDLIVQALDPGQELGLGGMGEGRRMQTAHFLQPELRDRSANPPLDR